MDIYTFALKMEKDGEAYYRELSEKTERKGLKRILILLANEEVKHYDIVQQLSQKVKNPQMKESSILEDSKNIFTQMKQTGEDVSRGVSEADLYRKAREIEKKSHEFYSQQAEETENKQQKPIFLKLAEEENMHMFLIDNLIDFITRPQTWLENAEWYHLDEY